MLKYEAKHNVSFPGEKHVMKEDMQRAYFFHAKYYCKIIYNANYNTVPQK